VSAPGGVQDKCSNAVAELRDRLVEMLEPDFGLLDQLLSNDLLTYRQVAQVTSCQFYQLTYEVPFVWGPYQAFYFSIGE